MANALAFAWQSNVQSGDRVAICNQNTPATVIGLLAAWRLGAAVMPLSPMLTRRELVHFLMDGEPSAAIVGVEQARVFQEAMTDWGGAAQVAVTFPSDHLAGDDLPQTVKSVPVHFTPQDRWTRMVEFLQGHSMPVSRQVFGREVAFLTYTSGTTGVPKAALNSHANVAFSADVYKRWLNLGPDDVLFAAAPFSHVTGLVAHIAAAFAARAPLVMCHRFEPGTVLDLLHERGCTTTVAAITAYIALLSIRSLIPRGLGVSASSSVVGRPLRRPWLSAGRRPQAFISTTPTASPKQPRPRIWFRSAAAHRSILRPAACPWVFRFPILSAELLTYKHAFQSQWGK
jgi:long-chain acyl-CoA synthetase